MEDQTSGRDGRHGTSPPGEAVAGDAPPEAAGATEPAGIAPASEAATVDTDATVMTEAVETPPVRIATPPDAGGPRRVSGRLTIVLGVLGIVAIGAVGAFGYSLNQDLTATRATLAATESDLATTRTTLDETTGELDTTNVDLGAASAERADLDSTIADLSAEVADQTKCVLLQGAALDELARISELQTANFNRTAEGSTWGRASDTRAKAVNNALDAYYQAYSKAFDGALSSARDWAAKGKAAQAVIAAQATQQAAELALIDRSAAEIQTALDALEAQLATLEGACQEVSR